MQEQRNESKDQLQYLLDEITEIKKRLSQLENAPTRNVCADARPIEELGASPASNEVKDIDIQRDLSGKNTREQQRIGTLLIMLKLKESGQRSATSSRISEMLLHNGIPNKRSDNAFTDLKKSGLIASKPNGKEIFLTFNGEHEAKKLAEELHART